MYECELYWKVVQASRLDLVVIADRNLTLQELERGRAANKLRRGLRTIADFYREENRS